MEISFFTGCVVPTRYPGMEAAVRRVAPMLGIELVDAEFGCCPSPVGLKSVHFDAWLALAARNLSIAGERGLDVVTVCSGCTNTLREAERILSRDEEKRLSIHDMLRRAGRTYRGGMGIRHLPELLAEEEVLERMEQRLARPLGGLRIGTHYGCHYFRPTAPGGEGAERSEGEKPPTAPGEPLPQDMEIILETLGAEVADYNRQDLCCGAALSINTGESAQSLAIAGEKLGWMREAGLDALAVACPACFTQFDTGQALLGRRHPAREPGGAEGAKGVRGPDARPIPVFHIAELVAYALGVEPEEMDLGSHKVKAPWIGARSARGV